MTTNPSTKRVMRFLDRAQWLGIVALGLWFVRRPAPDPLDAPPHPAPVRQIAAPARLDELSRMSPEARARAETLGPAMRSELSRSLEKIRRAERAVRDANALRTSDSVRATALLRAALDDNPYNPDALEALAAESLARGAIDEAFGLATRCHAVDSGRAGCASLVRAVGIARDRNTRTTR